MASTSKAAGVEPPTNLVVTRALELLASPTELRGRRLIAVWLFGSHVRGTATAGSDLDLAILCDPPLDLERFRLMDVLGRALSLDVDVIDLRNAPPLLAWEIITTGRLIQEADEPLVEEFVRRTRFDAEDAEQRDRMILLAQIDPGGAA